MSRIGKQPISIPGGVSISIKGSEVTVKGPKGELVRSFDPAMKIEVKDDAIEVTRPTDQRNHRSLHGLTRALLANMVTGVTDGFEIRMQIIGTGYRAEMAGDDLKLSLGYSHDIQVVPPPDVSFEVGERGQWIVVRSIDKELIGQIAADIRGLRPPEPYKGKGIRYDNEYVRQKAGKAGKLGA
jgi:large subunit ribosomal protein L6